MATLPGPSSPATDVPEWATRCQTCKALWLLFSGPESESATKISLGSPKEALSTTCPNHKALVQAFIDFVFSEGPHGEKFDNSVLELEREHKDSSVAIYSWLNGGAPVWHLLLVKKDGVPGHPGNGRLLDTDWADAKIAKEWKNRCISSHGAKCENPLRVWPGRPAWLVDVKKQCIVPGHLQVGYVALSYTYGSYAQPVISSDDFKRLQEPFALRIPEYSNFLSPIIRHAMDLTSSLDERYLWADALCITHHDPAVASEQLRMMGVIYANAIVTIVAADGDSQSGLLGLEGISNPRGIRQNIISFGDEKIMVRNTRFMNHIGSFTARSKPYYRRGWTCQEYTMAKRKLIFNTLELHWVCTCSLWHEELTLFSEIDAEVTPYAEEVLSGFPDDSSLRAYFDEYNQRSLTFEEDALPALSGLLSIFSRSFEGGFLYGIPEMFFEHGLCWRLGYGEDLQRRIPSGRTIESRFASSGLPSWSWLGWKGSIDTRHQTAVRVDSYGLEECVEEAFPITDWYTSRLPTDLPQQRRKIRPTWFEKRDSYKDFTKPMPPGWTRVDTTTLSSHHDDDRLYPDGCERYVFKHQVMLEKHGRPLEWYYPFPVNGINESTAPCMPEQTEYLFCETVQASLLGYRQDPDRLRSEWDKEAKLCDRLGNDIGKLHLPNKETRDRFSDNVNGSETGLLVDVIAVCKLKRCSKTWDRETRRSRLPIFKEELYLVLWIEWKDGIAYRLASGEVMASEWERLDLEKVSLVLG